MKSAVAIHDLQRMNPNTYGDTLTSSSTTIIPKFLLVQKISKSNEKTSTKFTEHIHAPWMFPILDFPRAVFKALFVVIFAHLCLVIHLKITCYCYHSKCECLRSSKQWTIDLVLFVSKVHTKVDNLLQTTTLGSDDSLPVLKSCALLGRKLCTNWFWVYRYSGQHHTIVLYSHDSFKHNRWSQMVPNSSQIKLVHLCPFNCFSFSLVRMCVPLRLFFWHHGSSSIPLDESLQECNGSTDLGGVLPSSM